MTSSSQIENESLFLQLRQATAHEHEEIQKFVPLQKVQVSLLEYKNFLCAALGFYRPLELKLYPFMKEQCDWTAKRQRTPLLVTELEWLGLRIDEQPECNLLPPIATPAQAWGCLYVFEGSTLGGKLITRHLRTACSELMQLRETERMPERMQKQKTFLDPYGADTGQMWKEFCHALTLSQKRSNDSTMYAQAVIASALQTFQCFRKWLQQ